MIAAPIAGGSSEDRRTCGGAHHSGHREAKADRRQGSWFPQEYLEEILVLPRGSLSRLYAGQQWEQLQKLGEWIWDKTAPVRERAASAWTWLKNKIGVGEGPEGQN